MSSQAADPRVVRTRERVINSVIDLLADHGYAEFSVEAVVQRTGIAKTTLYRHWPDRTALLRDAVAALGGAQTLPDTGGLRDDLLEFFAPRIRAADSRRWERCMPALVEAAAFDPVLAAVVSSLTIDILDGLVALLQRGASRGELSGASDASFLASVLIGPIVFRRLLLQEAPSRELVTAHVDRVLQSAGINDFGVPRTTSGEVG